MNVTAIIGNGLDISLGMKTTYSDFYKYVQENDVHKKNDIYASINSDPDTWSNFELGLGAYTQQIESLVSKKDRQHASDMIYESFNEVLEDLGDYLQMKSDEFKAKKPSYTMKATDFYAGLPDELARKITTLIQNKLLSFNFITLNYTDTLEALLYPERAPMERRGMRLGRIHHAHGSLTGYMTMGVSNESQLSAALEGDHRDNLIKPKLLESLEDDRLLTTHRMITESNLLIIYGSSLGETDQYIWQSIGEWLRGSDSYVILHDFNPEYLIRPSRNPIRQKQLDSEAKNRLIERIEGLTDEEKVNLRSRVLVVRNTTRYFKP